MFVDASFKNISSLSGCHPFANMKRGVFGLGNQTVDSDAEAWITSGGGKREDDKIVVSGTCANALVVLGRLLSLGVSSERLVWLAPFSADSSIELGHADVRILL